VYRIAVSSTRLVSSSRHVFDPDMSLKKVFQLRTPNTQLSQTSIELKERERERV
jgi:hypothetical protein